MAKLIGVDEQRMLSIKFDEPQHGWLSICIIDLESEITLEISDVPNNFISELAVALNNLKNGSVKEDVLLSLEPEFALLRFQSNINDIDLYLYPLSTKDKYIKFTEKRHIVLQTMYKALRDLEAMPCWLHPNAIETVWSWDFPKNELDKFKAGFKGVNSFINF